MNCYTDFIKIQTNDNKIERKNQEKKLETEICRSIMKKTESKGEGK